MNLDAYYSRWNDSCADRYQYTDRMKDNLLNEQGEKIEVVYVYFKIQ